jgi:hypothetical protein
LQALFQSAQHFYEKMEGSGAGPLTNESGSGRPQNKRTLRIRIPNLDFFDVNVFQKVWRIHIRITLGSRIRLPHQTKKPEAIEARIRIKEKVRIQMRIKVKMRIHINVMLIRKTGSHLPVTWAILHATLISNSLTKGSS